jgi:hypothetical protein
MLTFAISLAVMVAVVGTAMRWAVRTERRRKQMEGAHASDH